MKLGLANAAAVLVAEYFSRVLFGGRASVVGALTYGISFYMKPRVYPGPPKQFAQMIGLMMTSLATV